MTTLAIVIGVGFLLILVAFSLPVELRFDVRSDNEEPIQVSVGLLWGLVWFPLAASEDFDSHSSSNANRLATNAKPSAHQKRGFRRGLVMIRNSELRRRLVRYTQKLFRTVRIKTLEAHVRIGLDDPADTGRLWGMIWPLSTLNSIRIEPDFNESVCSLNGCGVIQVVPIQFVWVGLGFFASPIVIRALASSS